MAFSPRVPTTAPQTKVIMSWITSAIRAASMAIRIRVEPDRDMAFFTEGEVNEIAVNPPECNFFHNEAASCRRESVALIIIAGIFS